MNRAIWYLKQMLPLTYRSRYTENGVRRFAVWRMWFGRSFAIDTYTITE